jgi:hypothetical protein
VLLDELLEPLLADAKRLRPVPHSPRGC